MNIKFSKDKLDLLLKKFDKKIGWTFHAHEFVGSKTKPFKYINYLTQK